MYGATGLFEGKERVLYIERGSTRLPSVEKALWKRLWA